MIESSYQTSKSMRRFSTEVKCDHVENLWALSQQSGELRGLCNFKLNFARMKLLIIQTRARLPHL